MAFRLDQLQLSPGTKGIRQIALGCNVLLLGWIGWMLAQPVMDRYRAEHEEQAAGLPAKQVARAPEPRTREQYDIAGWHLFGVPSSQPARAEPEKANAPKTRLNLELNGIYHGDRIEDSRAIIAQKGKPQEHYRAGDALPGNAVLDEIHENHVLLLRQGRYERLELTEPPVIASTVSVKTARTPPERQDRKSNTAPLPGESAPISKLLNLYPVMSDNQFKGMHIRGMSNEGRRLLQKSNVRLKANDIVIAVNGIEIRSPEDGKTLLDNYSSSDQLELIIKRGRERIPVIIDPASGN